MLLECCSVQYKISVCTAPVPSKAGIEAPVPWDKVNTQRRRTRKSPAQGDACAISSIATIYDVVVGINVWLLSPIGYSVGHSERTTACKPANRCIRPIFFTFWPSFIYFACFLPILSSPFTNSVRSIAQDRVLKWSWLPSQRPYNPRQNNYLSKASGFKTHYDFNRLCPDSCRLKGACHSVKHYFGYFSVPSE